MEQDTPPPDLAAGNVEEIPPWLIRRRAVELALMDGRPEEEVTDADLRRAEVELTPSMHQQVEVPEDTLDPEDALASRSHERTSIDESPQQSDLVELIESGIERAVEDDVLVAGRETVEEGRTERVGDE